MLYFLLNDRFSDCYNDINIECDLFINTKREKLENLMIFMLCNEFIFI